MRFANLLSVAVLALTCSFAAPVMAADKGAEQGGADKKAEAFIANVGQQAMDTIQQSRDGKISDEQAKINFRKILNNSFDIPTIAKFTMGRYWRVATPAEQKEFTGLLQTVILDKYADRMLGYSGDGFKVTQSRVMNERDSGVVMTIKPAGKPNVEFGWRVRKTGASYKVIDLSVEGISMSVTHRSDFASVIERNGGQVKALIDALKNKEPLPSDKE